MTAPIRLSGLARRLVSEGLLSEDQAQAAQATAKQASQSFVTYLVNNKLLKSDVIGAIASQEFGVPLFDLDSMNMELAPTSLFQEKLIRQHNALPLFQRGKRLYVAVSDPTNLQALDEFQFNTALNTYLFWLMNKNSPSLSKRLLIIKIRYWMSSTMLSWTILI